MEDKYYLKLGETIRSIRRSRNYSQEYMAHKLGISQNVYSKIENGKCKCSVYRFIIIVGLLEVDIEEMEKMLSF